MEYKIYVFLNTFIWQTCVYWILVFDHWPSLLTDIRCSHEWMFEYLPVIKTLGRSTAQIICLSKNKPPQKCSAWSSQIPSSSSGLEQTTALFSIRVCRKTIFRIFQPAITFGLIYLKTRNPGNIAARNVASQRTDPEKSDSLIQRRIKYASSLTFPSSSPKRRLGRVSSIKVRRSFVEKPKKRRFPSVCSVISFGRGLWIWRSIRDSES